MVIDAISNHIIRKASMPLTGTSSIPSSLKRKEKKGKGARKYCHEMVLALPYELAGKDKDQRDHLAHR